MKYEEVLTLIPSHCMEDLPTEAGEDEACGLLNAFAVPWHPGILALSENAPAWHRSDEPPHDFDRRLIFVPKIAEDWLPHEWIAEARERGATIIAGLKDRDELLAATLKASDVETNDKLDPEVTADFLALGTCRLMTELLTCHMHHYTGMDEELLEREALAGAIAAVDGDSETARKHLLTAFDCLTEARERFYPVRCYLLDVCLMMSDLFDKHFDRLLASETPVNLLIKSDDLRQSAESHPEQIAKLKSRIEAENLNLIGGDRNEATAPTFAFGIHAVGLRTRPANPQKTVRPNSTNMGPAAVRIFIADSSSGQTPRLPFSFYTSRLMTACIPMPNTAEPAGLGVTAAPLAQQLGFHFRRTVPAVSCDSPCAWRRRWNRTWSLPITFAHWPEVKSPWLEDFQRAHSYAPTLGEFVTFDSFIEGTDDSSDEQTWADYEYLSPFFLQAVARQESEPISRFTQHFRRRLIFDSVRMMERTHRVLMGAVAVQPEDQETESTIEAAGPDCQQDEILAADQLLTTIIPAAQQKLSQLITHKSGSQPGRLLINPLSFERKVALESDSSDPAARGIAKISVPANGYAWISESDIAAKHGKSGGPLLFEDGILRNELFEVHINKTTGGIARVKGHGRRPNRISQQLAFRFPREQVVKDAEGNESKTFYSTMTCQSVEAVKVTTGIAIVKTTGQLIDPSTEEPICGFTQTVTIRRGLPTIDLHLELDEPQRTPEGDPWSNYIASRFAWNDSTASVTRSVYGQAQEIRGERFESPHYIELATPEERTTIVTHGLPFHRKTSDRMIDSILVVAGESRRSFDFTIAIDQPLPMQTALDAMVPVEPIPNVAGPPTSGENGWFFHIDVRNVQLTSLLDLLPVPAEPETYTGSESEPEQIPKNGFAVRLLETEGRRSRVTLKCFRTPTWVRQRDFSGKTTGHPSIEGDSVIIEMTRYEIADIELRFD